MANTVAPRSSGLLVEDSDDSKIRTSEGKFHGIKMGNILFIYIYTYIYIYIYIHTLKDPWYKVTY
jgi:hypothetical protein